MSASSAIRKRPIPTTGRITRRRGTIPDTSPATRTKARRLADSVCVAALGARFVLRADVGRWWRRNLWPLLEYFVSAGGEHRFQSLDAVVSRFEKEVLHYRFC